MKSPAIDKIGKDKCAGCFGCYNSCNQHAIEMVLDEEGFFMPKINEDKCINCGLCQKNCPVINKAEVDNLQFPKVFGAWSKNEEIRINSSSGGIFTEIAELILKQGGVVFGVAFNNSCNRAEHVIIENKTDLNRVRGSKYIQSYVGNSYKKVLEFVVKGRTVLFSGTPCQIAALNAFLKDEKISNSVITCEVICHGVPSQSVFLGYIDYLQKKYNSRIIKYNFRDKKLGWYNYIFSVEIIFSNNKKLLKDNKTELFIRGFLKNIYLRKSCYDCLFAIQPRMADITLGDFWGVGELNLESVKQQDLNKGVSAVLLNTKKGMDLFNLINDIEKFETNIDVIKKYNHRVDSFRFGMDANKRKKFYEFFNTHNFNVAIKKTIGKPSRIKKLINFLTKLSSRLGGIRQFFS